MVYLDNAATSFPKPGVVYKAVQECIKTYCGNPGRSLHRLARRAGEEIFEARAAIARFFGSEHPERVVFTQNATHALNLAIKTAIPKNSGVLISDVEHNAVYRPLKAEEERRGLSVMRFSSDGDVEKNLKAGLTARTRAVVSTIRSNVTGARIPLALLSDFARREGLLLIIDGSQSAGHEKIDLSKTPCDVFCAPGHKGLFGIQGSGFALFRDDIPRESFIEGGSGSESRSVGMPRNLPERFEAGTLPTPSIVALRRGIEWIERYGIDRIEKELERLTEEAKYALNEIDRIVFLQGEGGILSFRIKDEDPARTAERLDRLGICVRSGLHCAPLAHEKFGTVETGTVRVSFSALNRERDIARLADALKGGK